MRAPEVTRHHPRGWRRSAATGAGDVARAGGW